MATVKVRLDAGEQIVTASIPKEAAEELGLTLPGGGNDQAETLLLALPDVADGVGHLLVASMPVLRQADRSKCNSNYSMIPQPEHSSHSPGR